MSFLERKTVRKRDILLNAGEICRHSIFVVDGALKSFTRSKDRSEHVISFALSNWWIADMYSLISQRPGTLTIEAISDAELLLLSKQKQDTLYEKAPKFERFFRILAENSLVANQQRIINNLTLTAEERYQHFTQNYPFVLGCAPLHNIASYLGMTPEFLSKIRRKLAGRLDRPAPIS
jgi:CRP-like cAMP-binding protein